VGRLIIMLGRMSQSKSLVFFLFLGGLYCRGYWLMIGCRRMEKSKMDKAKRKRRQLYGGVGSERRRRAWKKRGGAQRLKGEDGKFLPATKA